MPRIRPLVLTLPALVLGLALTACGGGDDGDGAAAQPGPSASGSPSASARASSTPTPTPPPRPAVSVCRALTYQRAIAASDDTRTVSCSRPHTAVTIGVGRLPRSGGASSAVLDPTGDEAQARIAAGCARSQSRYLGGDATDRELSMLHVVWFVPTAEELDAGAAWYRCDVVALAGDKRLARISGGLRGVLDDAKARAPYAVCGTARPGTSGFERVACSQKHSWQAIDVVGLKAGSGGAYPGESAAKAAGQDRCESVAKQQADDPLRFQWGYEWPTASQWEAGQRVGLCWTTA